MNLLVIKEEKKSNELRISIKALEVKGLKYIKNSTNKLPFTQSTKRQYQYATK